MEFISSWIFLVIVAKVCASLIGQFGNVLLKVRDNERDKRQSKGEWNAFCDGWMIICNNFAHECITSIIPFKLRLDYQKLNDVYVLTIEKLS